MTSEVVVVLINTVCITYSIFFLSISAIRMAETEEYSTVDAILPNIQETEVSLGTACWSSGQFQGWTRSRNDFEEIVC